MKRVIVLANIGTPDSPTPADVGVYLRQFLMDRDVIPFPFPLRWLLVNALIVPRRRHTSSALYKKIWSERGSPLRYLSQDLAREMQNNLPIANSVEVAMRYGSPSIEEVLLKVKDAEYIDVVPMFPQYAGATTGSIKKECLRIGAELGITNKISFVPEFYAEDFYIDSLVEKILPVHESIDHLLFSFHGLPEKLIAQQNVEHCLRKSNCCDNISQANSKCYRAQCFATTARVAGRLKLSQDKYSISFQSRLGRGEWIKPYTEDSVRELARKGVARLGIVCPAFLIDCLETLEEIAIGMREVFLQEGGKELVFIPCLNADPQWNRRFSEWINHGTSSRS